MSKSTKMLCATSVVLLVFLRTGIGPKVCILCVNPTVLEDLSNITDAPDVYNSPLFTLDRDSASGLGGWGDPSNDFQVPTGGFSDFHLSYPSSHIVRRNFTLQPFIDDTDTGFFPNPDLYANATFTQDEVDYMVNNFVGDFVGFQKYMEGFQVSFFSIFCMHTSTWHDQGAHGAVHFILGGWV